MLNWLKTFKGIGVLIGLILTIPPVLSKEFSAEVSYINIDTKSDGPWLELNADIDFRLSPMAKEALQKGIALSWAVIIKIEQEGWLWNTTVEQRKLKYTIKNYALLNLYSVNDNGEEDRFSTLKASLNSMSKIRNLAIIKKKSIKKNKKYQVLIKVGFEREALPIPLRPISYFDSQWALSSRWTLWQLQK
ncbi:MAG: DUF4390 domain-containing protein [Methylococcaceae bacterium]